MDSEIPLNPKTSLADEEEKDRNEEKGQQVECKGIFPDKLYRLENFANRIHNQSQDANIVTTVNQEKISNSPVSEDNALSQCNENSESGSNKMIKIEEMCEPQLIEERAEDERSLDCMASISTGEHIIGTGTVRNGKSVSVVNAKQLTACESNLLTLQDPQQSHGCAHCCYQSHRLSDLLKHIRTSHSVVKQYKCDLCNYNCSDEKSLQSHYKIHKCELCDYISTGRNALRVHLKTHTKDRPFSCEFCESKFTTASHLKSHLRTHKDEKPLSCEFCEYKTFYASNLKSHIKRHTGEKTYSCEFCDYKSFQSSELKRHLRNHTGEKPFNCELCEYKFNALSELKIHLRTHSGEKPFSCEFCEFKSSRAHNLKVHLRTHTGTQTKVKLFRCEFCAYKCSVASNLKKHLRKHTGEKPYSCEFCEYKSSQNSNLKKHLRKHTEENSFSVVDFVSTRQLDHIYEEATYQDTT